MVCISQYFVLNKLSECNHVSIYYVQKVLKITLHSYIVTLQSKNKNNAFKVEVKFTKLKIKEQKAQTE